MAYTTADLDRLDRAIASGTLTVEIGGRKITYHGIADLLKARAEVGAPVNFADDVQIKLTEAVAALSSARTSMVGVHAGLADAALRLGMRSVMIGPYCMDNFRLRQDEGQRSVA